MCFTCLRKLRQISCVSESNKMGALFDVFRIGLFGQYYI